MTDGWSGSTGPNAIRGKRNIQGGTIAQLRAADGYGLGPGADPPSGRPNIVLIMTDDQPKRRTWTRAILPQIFDRMVDGGIDYDLGYAAVPLCTPTRASILSGTYQHNHQVTANTSNGYSQTLENGALDDTPAVRLNALGYRCGYFGKMQNGYSGTHLPPGYDQTAWVIHADTVSENDDEHNWDWNMYGTVTNPNMHSSHIISDAVEAFIAEQGSLASPEPFFITASYMSPHWPYSPVPEHEHDFDNVALDVYPSMNLNQAGTTTQRVVQEAKMEETREVDDGVERIFTALADNGFDVSTDTYVFLTSDNGYLLGEHSDTQKDKPWEEAVNIPYTVVGPGVSQGVNSRALVSHVDLPATFCDLGGAQWSDYDGRSLVPTFDGTIPSGWREHVLVESLGQSFAVLRMENYAYHRFNSGTRRVFDMTALDSDPEDTYQITNLSATVEGTSFMSTYDSITQSLRACSGQGCRDLETL